MGLEGFWILGCCESVGSTVKRESREFPKTGRACLEGEEDCQKRLAVIFNAARSATAIVLHIQFPKSNTGKVEAFQFPAPREDMPLISRSCWSLWPRRAATKQAISSLCALTGRLILDMHSGRTGLAFYQHPRVIGTGNAAGF